MNSLVCWFSRKFKNKLTYQTTAHFDGQQKCRSHESCSHCGSAPQRGSESMAGTAMKAHFCLCLSRQRERETERERVGQRQRDTERDRERETQRE